jgi:uncharacterized protein YjiS (DUF1127 family)
MTHITTASAELSFVSRGFGVVAEFLRNRAARRAQRIALTELLRMSPDRLDDLGINHQDVAEALAAPPPAGPRLAQRREARALGSRA